MLFQNDRYMTRGVNAEIPLVVQLFIWDCIDHLPKERDYFQVFSLEPMCPEQGDRCLYNGTTCPNRSKRFRDKKQDFCGSESCCFFRLQPKFVKLYHN